MAGRGSIAPYMALCRLNKIDTITVVINPPWVLIVKSDADICPLSVFGTLSPQLIPHGTLIPQLIPDDKRDTVASHKTLRGRDVRANPAGINPANHAE